MLLLILKTPIVFESIKEILTDLHTESIVLQGSQVRGPEADQNLELPLVGGFLRMLEQDQPDSKAVLTVMPDEILTVFEEKCKALYGDLNQTKDLTALVLPLSRTMGRQMKFAG
jgi:hypothetical protein